LDQTGCHIELISVLASALKWKDVAQRLVKIVSSQTKGKPQFALIEIKPFTEEKSAQRKSTIPRAAYPP
jgi:hypothetical protein